MEINLDDLKKPHKLDEGPVEIALLGALGAALFIHILCLANLFFGLNWISPTAAAHSLQQTWEWGIACAIAICWLGHCRLELYLRENEK